MIRAPPVASLSSTFDISCVIDVYLPPPPPPARCHMVHQKGYTPSPAGGWRQLRLLVLINKGGMFSLRFGKCLLISLCTFREPGTRGFLINNRLPVRCIFCIQRSAVTYSILVDR